MSKKLEISLPESRQENQKLEGIQGKIFVISGPSGSGKTTLTERIIKSAALKNKIKKSISFTTRPKRSNERENKEYFFITEEQFKQYLRAKKILEWTKYLGYYYGTPRDLIDEWLRKRVNIVLCVDLKGVLRLARLYPENIVKIFIMPPSLEELRTRIEKRSSEINKIEIHSRVKLAEKEVLSAEKFDYCLVNKNLDKTVKQLKEIILREINNKQ